MGDLDPTEVATAIGAAAAAERVAARRRAAGARATIGRFEVREKLGEGGMGVVYEAYDPQLDRPVAIKLVLVDRVGAHGRARLLREAQAMAKVAHPNVVPIYEVGELGAEMFVAMELVTGETLTSWLRRAPRTWRDALAIFVAAGRGLAAAHACGIVHRDFKPDNVLVGSDGRPRVLDFGLARSVTAPPAPPEDAPAPAAGNALSVELTVAGSLMGTPPFMSPEQFRGEVAGPASDQFSFASGLYRALFGVAPFAGENLVELRASVLDDALRPPPAASEVPPAVVAAVLRALSPNAGDRFASMDELLDVLEPPLRVDPAQDLARGRRGRLIASAILSAGALASLIATSAATGLDASARGLLVQSVVATTCLVAIGATFWRRLVTSEHNRRLAFVILATGCGFFAHRAVAYLRDASPVDTLAGDAVLLGVVATVAGILVERWMLGGAPLAVLYLAFALAVPHRAGPAFGGLVLVYAIAAAWRWGDPAPRTRPPR